jgi:hypothetical protein
VKRGKKQIESRGDERDAFIYPMPWTTRSDAPPACCPAARPFRPSIANEKFVTKVLAHRYDSGLDFYPASFVLRFKRMNATIDLNIAVQITVLHGSKFNSSKRGAL